MTITEKSIKLLWSASAGRCAFPGCWQQLVIHDATVVAPHTIGEMAHIHGRMPGSCRHDPTQTPKERDDYQNLILLCPTHHTEIDQPENEAVYTAEKLFKMKALHEQVVQQKLRTKDFATKGDLARRIHQLLESNRQAWQQYGPESELARTQPHNSQAHSVWMTERLSTIVPNNRAIAAMLKEHRNLLDTGEIELAETFLIHQRGYESWVEDDIPYAAVKRFPRQFSKWIGGLAHASPQ